MAGRPKTKSQLGHGPKLSKALLLPRPPFLYLQTEKEELKQFFRSISYLDQRYTKFSIFCTAFWFVG